MSRQIRYRGSRSRPPRPSQKKAKDEKGTFLDELKKAATQRAVQFILFLVISFLILIFALIIKFTSVGDLFRTLKNETDDFGQVKSYPMEGIVVDCDSIPIKGLTVVVKGYDVPTTTTNDKGYFTNTVSLPVALNEVSIRFLDANDRVVYSTLYTLDKNNVKKDQVQIYAIPDVLTFH